MSAGAANGNAAKGAPLYVTLHVDGGSRGNPGLCGAGALIAAGDDGTVLYEGGFYLGQGTCNFAEYRGLIEGLKAAIALGADQIDVYSDSQLLVRQMTGEYRVRNGRLQDLHAEAVALAASFARCTYRHVPRERNRRADELANQAMNLRRSVEDAAP